MVGFSANAQDLRNSYLELAFSSKFERPLTISTYQAPHGFLEKLIDRDKDQGIIDSSKRWMPFIDADVWIFFVENWNEVEHLGPIPVRVFESSEIASDTATLRRDITVSGDRKIMLKYVSMEAFSGDDQEVLVCKIVASTYRDLSGFNTGEEFSKC